MDIVRVIVPSCLLCIFRVCFVNAVPTNRRITSRRTRSTNYNSNYDKFDETNDYSDDTDSGDSTLFIVMIIIGIFVVFTMCIICCYAAREQSNEQNAVESPVQYTQQSVPPVSVQAANAADAPSYESLFQQQQQLPSNEGATEWQTHARVSDEQSPSQRRSESRPPYHIPLETNFSSASPTGDHTILTAPPPSYADLGFPPAYPGIT